MERVTTSSGPPFSVDELSHSKRTIRRLPYTLCQFGARGPLALSAAPRYCQIMLVPADYAGQGLDAEHPFS